MPINTLEYSKIMMAKLDQAAKRGLTSGWMEPNAAQVTYNGGDTVRMPEMSTKMKARFMIENWPLFHGRTNLVTQRRSDQRTANSVNHKNN
ncbi:hypothetical protein HCH52_05090 [Oscillospiraceae bacterium HV4-5-C5C]|nr:hypothetical protein [Oscillospiraceae bacterium HV4-5-C5C]